MKRKIALITMAAVMALSVTACEDLTAESQRQIILPDRKWQIRTNRWYGSTDSRQTVPRENWT